MNCINNIHFSDGFKFISSLLPTLNRTHYIIFIRESDGAADGGGGDGDGSMRQLQMQKLCCSNVAQLNYYKLWNLNWNV